MTAVRALLLLTLLACACRPVDAAAPEPTVGTVTENNGLSKSGYLVVKTPSILRIGESKPVTPDARQAIAHYDAVSGLSSDPAIRAEAMRRSAYLRLSLAEASDSGDETEVRKAAAIYRQLLTEIPGDPANDRTLYQLAHACQLLGETVEASDALRKLGRDYPQSLLAGDAHFRAGELLFLRKLYAEAEKEYSITLGFGETSSYFAQSQYKYAWSLYLQDKFEPALTAFLAVVDRHLAVGELSDAATDRVIGDKSEMAAASLRAADLALMAMGGSPALGHYFDAHGGEPRYATLLYRSLAELQLQKRRYSDAAASFSTYAALHPRSALSPVFQSRAIDAYLTGGFAAQAMTAKAVYVDLYNPVSSRWAGQAPPEDILRALRTHLEDLGRYHQATAQSATGDTRRVEFETAATFYRNLLEWFPQDTRAAQVNLLYADALLDAGRTAEAAQQYLQTAYAHPQDKLAPEAAYAAVQSLHKLADESAGADMNNALRQSADASVKLADAFPAHPHWTDALSAAAGSLQDVGDHAQAISLALRVLDSGKPITLTQKRELLCLIADSQFAQKDYVNAEAGYATLLQVEDGSPPAAKRAAEQLAASIYKQGEQARERGDLRAAANQFLRIGSASPGASIRAIAEYDAASALIDLHDWPAAEIVLENFRQRFPTHALLPAADKKLAMSYQKDGKLEAAADSYARIAKRNEEPTALRIESAWLSAQLYDQAGLTPLSARAYDSYLTNFSAPLRNRMKAMRRLADIASNDRSDDATYLKWLNALVSADVAAGSSGDTSTHMMAAQAALEIGRAQANQARLIALHQPLAANLARRKQAMDSAIGTLLQAAHYDFSDITPAASFEIGRIYRDFSAALLDSERPSRLRGEEREQYDLLLEEQANPFELKAIAAHEANLQRVNQGLWNDWIHRSTTQLAELEPAKYAKHETNETIYEDIH